MLRTLQTEWGDRWRKRWIIAVAEAESRKSRNVQVVFEGKRREEAAIEVEE